MGDHVCVTVPVCVTVLLGVPEPLREGDSVTEPQPVVVTEEEAQRE